VTGILEVPVGTKQFLSVVPASGTRGEAGAMPPNTMKVF